MKNSIDEVATMIFEKNIGINQELQYKIITVEEVKACIADALRYDMLS